MSDSTPFLYTFMSEYRGLVRTFMSEYRGLTYTFMSELIVFITKLVRNYSSKNELSLTNSSNIGRVTTTYPCLPPSRIPFLIKRDL